jgi:hypothetical protein
MKNQVAELQSKYHRTFYQIMKGLIYVTFLFYFADTLRITTNKLEELEKEFETKDKSYLKDVEVHLLNFSSFLSIRIAEYMSSLHIPFTLLIFFCSF